jgi:hypothetical protein
VRVYYPEIMRLAPFRSPSWRWERATRLVKDRRYFCPWRDDEQTGAAVRYLRDLRRLPGERGLDKLARRHPEVHAARTLHDRADRLTTEVQGRLLARQPFGAIEQATGVRAEALRSYEALFFNVTDRLDVRDWVTAIAIGWRKFDPAKGRDKATVFRAYSYHGGPLVLGAVKPYLLGDELRQEPALDTSAPEGERDLSIRLAIEIDTAPWTAAADVKFFRLHAVLLEHERARGERRPRGLIQTVRQRLTDFADARRDSPGQDSDGSGTRQPA